MRETLRACCLIGLVLASPAVAQTAAPETMQSPRLSAAAVAGAGCARCLRISIRSRRKATPRHHRTCCRGLMPRPQSCFRTSPSARSRYCCRSIPRLTCAIPRKARQAAPINIPRVFTPRPCFTLAHPGTTPCCRCGRGCARPRAHLRPARGRADFRLSAALRPRWFGRRRSNRGAAARQPVSRHPPGADRKPPALRLVRYGVPYFVSIECFDGPTSSRRLWSARPTKWPCASSKPSMSSAARPRPAAQAWRRSRSRDRKRTHRVPSLLRRATSCPAPARAATAGAPISPFTPTSASPWRKGRPTPIRNRS